MSFDVPDGSFFVVLGPSGAGKTTTLRAIAGLERLDGGSVHLDGKDATGDTPAARDLAMVFQGYALYPRRTAYENIASPLRARRASSTEIAAAVEKVASLLHIERLLQRRPAQMSGGEMQRVALARALVRSPRAFLMDEPLTNLDLKLRVEMRTELTRIHRSLGKTFVYVTNDQVEALSMADQIAVLREGKVQQCGTPTEVYERPANQWVAGFVGSPRISLLACHAEGDRLVGAEGWTLPRPRWTTAEDGRPLLLGLRAEDLSVDKRGEASLPGELYGLEPLGDRTVVDVKVGEEMLKVKAKPTVTGRARGAPVRHRRPRPCTSVRRGHRAGVVRGREVVVSEPVNQLSVGMVGYAFMGAAHSQAWRNAPRFFDLPLRPRLTALAGRDAARVGVAADRLGWASTETSWQALVARDDIDLVDVCTPGDTHAEIAIAALEAGKHVLCEKPLANTVEEAEAMTLAAEKAAASGVQIHGRLHLSAGAGRSLWLGSWSRKAGSGPCTTSAPSISRTGSWTRRHRCPGGWIRAKAGSGALGDIGAHIVDLAQHITGDAITRVSGRLQTFVDERPLPCRARRPCRNGRLRARSRHRGRRRGVPRGVPRRGTGCLRGHPVRQRPQERDSHRDQRVDRQPRLRLRGHEPPPLLRRQRACRHCRLPPDHGDRADSHPYVGAWWPPGHLLGYEHGFTHQVVDLVRDIAAGIDPSPSFADGLQVQRVLAAVETSSETDSWQEIPS